jgi:anthranilate synthase component 1
MLESCEDKESSGRYTFLGFDPQAEIHCKDGKGTVMDENGSRTFTGSPKSHIAALLERHKSPRLRELPTFTGGWATLPTTTPNTASRGWS